MISNFQYQCKNCKNSSKQVPRCSARSEKECPNHKVCKNKFIRNSKFVRNIRQALSNRGDSSNFFEICKVNKTIGVTTDYERLERK